MKNLKTLVFTATYNEAENILVFIRKVEKLNLNLDLLIIDDNSPDLTPKIVRKLFKEHKKNINLIIRNNKQGLDTAHKLAYNFAIKNNYHNLITMDADLSHDPEEIPEFFKST